MKHLRTYFGDRKLKDIDERAVVEYRSYLRRQPLKWNPKRTVKGATVNRELACLHCVFQFALKRKYIGENSAAGVNDFDERLEKPSKRMLTVEEEHRMLEGAQPHLRVAIVLVQTCDDREFRLHPCVDLEDWESLCRTIDEYFQVQVIRHRHARLLISKTERVLARHTKVAGSSRSASY